MNEDSVKQKVSEHLKQNEVAQGHPGLIDDTHEDLPPIEVFSNNLPLDNMMLRFDTLDFLGVPAGARQDAETISKVDAVLRWASENSQRPEEGDLLETIHRQLRTMGKQMSDNRLDTLYRYVRLHNQRGLIELQMRNL
jgi:hypothetical protein